MTAWGRRCWAWAGRATRVAPLQRAVSFASAPRDSLGESGFALAQALWKTGQSAGGPERGDPGPGALHRAGMDARVGEVDSWLKSLPWRRPARLPARLHARARP